MMTRNPGSLEKGGNRSGVDFKGEHLTGAIIGAAIDVHRALGPGYIEIVYERAMRVELRLRGIAFEQQLRVPIAYRGVEIGSHRLDLFVERAVVVELKAVKEFDEIHFAILRSYLKATGGESGLLLNFSKARLEVKRIFGPSVPRVRPSP